jgi:hypothetical protein
MSPEESHRKPSSKEEAQQKELDRLAEYRKQYFIEKKAAVERNKQQVLFPKIDSAPRFTFNLFQLNEQIGRPVVEQAPSPPSVAPPTTNSAKMAKKREVTANNKLRLMELKQKEERQSEEKEEDEEDAQVSPLVSEIEKKREAIKKWKLEQKKMNRNKELVFEVTESPPKSKPSPASTVSNSPASGMLYKQVMLLMFVNMVFVRCGS